MNRQLNPSQSLYIQVRRDILSSMETGNIDRARTVLAEYRETAQAMPELEDMSEDLRTDVVAAYGVSI